VLLLLATLGVVISVVPAPPLQKTQPDSDVAAPCPAESADQAMPVVGIGRTVPPRVRKKVVADPPSTFLDARVDGRVVVSGIVDTDGTLCDIRAVHSSHSGLGLEDTGIASAKQWLFAAAMRDGAPVRAPVSIEFTLSAYKDGPRPGQRGRTARAEVRGADPLLKDLRPRSGPAVPR